MVSTFDRLFIVVSVIPGPRETVFLASLVTRPQGDVGSAIFVPQDDRVGWVQSLRNVMCISCHAIADGGWATLRGM